MAYNKHEWQNGELITSQLMNNIENGLEEVLGGNLLESLASSYDPSSTYQGGEIVTYNNRLYRIIGNEVTGEWDNNNAEEIQIMPLLNRDEEITNNRIENLSTLLTYVMENIAEIYIPSKRHYTGDYVWYLYTLYRFIVDQPESDFHSFDSSEVEVVNVMDIFKEIINNSFGEIYSNTKSYSVGNYVLYKNKIYKCIEDTIPGTFEDNFSRFSLTTITNELGNFNQVKIDIERDALTAEAYACGTQNETAITDSTHFAFENNAKYYSDLISGDAGLVEAYTTGKYKGVDITSTDSGEYAGAYHNNAKYYYEQIANELELVSALFPEGYENLVSDIGTAFNSASHTYHVGDYCVHDSKLYRCTTEFTATNTWENGNYDSNFTEVNIGDELSVIKNGNSAIINSSITSNVAPEYNSQNTYDIGDYITYNNEFYRCINPVTTTNNTWETISSNFIKINIAKELMSLKNITNNSAREFILANSGYWIVGTLAAADGTPLDNTTTRLRYNGFLNMKGNMVTIKTKNNYEFLVYAWNKSDNSYLGCLKTNGQFEKTTGSYLWLKEYNIASQPELKFKIVMRNATNTSAVMTPDDCVNCLCTRLDINNDIIAYEFDPAQMWPYKAGEYVRYETQLYRFKVNHVGPWAAGDVERVNVGEELNNISAIAANYIAESFDSGTSYEGGDYVTKEGKMYQITENSGLTSYETNVASEINKILNLMGVTIIPFVKGKFINTGANSETGLINTNPSSSSNWQYALVPCQPNDSFTITGTGGNRFHFLWSFMASDFSQIPNYNSGTSAVAENSIVVAPDNAAYLIVNALVDQPALLCRGENIQAKFNNLSSAFLNYKLLQSDDDILKLKNGVYRKNTGNTPINWPEVFPDNISSTYGTLISFVAASEYRILIYFPGKQASSVPLRQANSCFLKIRSNGAWGDWLSFKIGTGKSVFNVNQEAIGSDFSVSSDYNDGDYVLNNGDLYKFNTSHSSGEWSSEDAEKTSIIDELSSLNDLINFVFTQTSSAISTEASNRQFFDNNEMMNRMARDNELMYMMAPEHVTNKAYSAGECVIHDGDLYEATVDVQTGTEFSSSNFTETTISSNILGVKAELNNSLSETTNEIDDLKGAINTAIRGLGQNLNSTTGATICSNDLNNLPRNTVYGLVPYSGLANMPYADTDSNGGIILTLSKESAVNATMTQIIVRRNGKIYMRQYWGSGYESWREYNTAAEIENEFNYVRDAISYITGYAPLPLKVFTQIVTGTTTGATITANQDVSSDTDSLIATCSPGDVFLITATGFTSYRTYCFIDSSNVILSMSTAGEALNKRKVTAPANAAKIIVNAKRASSPRYVYKLSTGLMAHTEFAPTAQNIISDTVSSICSGDANNIPNNNIYGISIASSAISHMPPFPDGGSGTYQGTFITFGKESARGYGDVQIYVQRTDGGSVFVRNYSSSWSSWSEYADYSAITSDIASLYSTVTSDISDAVSPVATDVAALKAKTYFSPTAQNIISDTVSSICSGDANNIPNNNIYGISIASSAITHMPPFPNGGSGTYQGTFLTFGKESARGYGDVQIYVQRTDGGSVFVRNYSSSWSSWSEYTDYSVLNTIIGGVVSDITNITGCTSIPFNENHAVSIGSTIGATINTTPISESSTDCIVETCVANDVFFVTGYGWNSERLWAFLDGDKKLLKVSSANEQRTRYKLEAPANSAYFIVNARRAYERKVYKQTSSIIGDREVFAPTAQNIISDTVTAICSGDANNIPNNNIYGISISYDSLSHMPFYPAGVNGAYQGTFLTFGKESARGYGDVQIYVQRVNNGGVYVRNYTNSWGSWKNLNSAPAISVLGIGDSICEGWRNNNLGFAGMLGLPFRNLGITGATLGAQTNHTQIYTEIENLEITEDLLIAEGGINDYYSSVPLGEMPSRPVINDTQAAEIDKTTTSGGLEYLLYLMIKNAPKAQRYFMITHKTKNYPYVNNYAGGYTQQQLHDRIVAICKLYNVKVIDVYEDSMLNSEFTQYVSPTAYSNSNKGITTQYYFDKDQIHPLWLGYQAGYLPVMLRAIQSAVMT